VAVLASQAVAGSQIDSLLGGVFQWVVRIRDRSENLPPSTKTPWGWRGHPGHIEGKGASEIIAEIGGGIEQL